MSEKQQQLQLIQDARPIEVIIASAKNDIKEGNIDPLLALSILTTYAKAIEQIKEDKEIRDICLKELSKYGRGGATINGFTFTEAEAGVKYDYSNCGSSTYAELVAQRSALDAEIKAWEQTLKGLPTSGLADPDTGEMLYPPVKSSKTIIKATIKR